MISLGRYFGSLTAICRKAERAESRRSRNSSVAPRYVSARSRSAVESVSVVRARPRRSTVAA